MGTIFSFCELRGILRSPGEEPMNQRLGNFNCVYLRTIILELLKNYGRIRQNQNCQIVFTDECGDDWLTFDSSCYKYETRCQYHPHFTSSFFCANVVGKILKIFVTFGCFYKSIIHRKYVINFLQKMTSFFNDICYKNYV